MGIKNLLTLARSFPGVERRKHLSEFSGHSIAVDGHALAYQAKERALRTRLHGQDPTRVNTHDTSTVALMRTEFLGLLAHLAAYNILPLLVFDGTAPEEKRETLEHRRQRRDATSPPTHLTARRGRARREERERLVRQILANVHVTYREHEDLAALAQQVGIPLLRATREADSTIAALTRHRLLVQGRDVVAGFSTDSDLLVCGTLEVLTSIQWHVAYSICIVDLLTALQLSQEQFVDLAILMGCDYNEGVPIPRPNRLSEILRRFNKIEDIPETLLPSTHRPKLCVERCRDIFTPPPANVINVPNVDVLAAQEVLRQPATTRDQQAAHTIATLILHVYG